MRCTYTIVISSSHWLDFVVTYSFNSEYLVFTFIFSTTNFISRSINDQNPTRPSSGFPSLTLARVRFPPPLRSFSRTVELHKWSRGRKWSRKWQNEIAWIFFSEAIQINEKKRKKWNKERKLEHNLYTYKSSV